MRKYKFRGKILENFGNNAGEVIFEKGKWIYGGITYDIDRVWIDTPYYGQILVEKETVGQFTGLKDKNGTEIYEGDIIFIKGETKLLDIKGKVEYSNILAQFIITNTGNIVNEAEPLGDYEEEDIEKIGNVYDNPELLEEGE